MVHEAQWVRRVDRRLEAPAAAADLDGLTIAQLSDFHVGFRPSFNLRAMRKAVDMALAARPDLVLVTGDFACGPHGRAELQRQLRRLADAAPLGVFGVLGNHDHGDSKAPFVQPTDPRAIEACGVRLLDNGTASVKVGAATVQIGGVDDTDGGHDDLPAVLAALDRRSAVLRILLTHHAQVVLRTAPGDFHIALAGDTHGGQICPRVARAAGAPRAAASSAAGAEEARDPRRDVVDRRRGADLGAGVAAVSYTHLTLPTIYSV